jgi:hypothetical protein
VAAARKKSDESSKKEATRAALGGPMAAPLGRATRASFFLSHGLRLAFFVAYTRGGLYI